MAELFDPLSVWTRVTHFRAVAVFNCVLQPSGNSYDVLSGRFAGPFVPGKSVKFRGPRLNLSREIPPEAVEGGIFDGFSR